MCSNLEKVMLGSNTESLESQAFFMSSKLESINLPNTIMAIEEGAFGTTSIKEITIPTKVEKLGVGVFAGCKIERIVIPGNVKVIDEMEFRGCTLQEVEIQEGVESIGERGFGDIDSLTSVILPNSAINIDERAFSGSKSDLTITAPSGSYAEQYAQDNDIPFTAQ